MASPTPAKDAEFGELYKQTFCWFLQNLCAPNSQIEACPVNIVETVFYHNGQAAELIRTDPKTGLLTSSQDSKSLAIDMIRKTIVTEVRERRKQVNKQKMMAQMFAATDLGSSDAFNENVESFQ